MTNTIRLPSVGNPLHFLNFCQGNIYIKPLLNSRQVSVKIEEKGNGIAETFLKRIEFLLLLLKKCESIIEW
jgi:hypothetical protein